MSRILVECACGCGRSKEVRKADLDRGWGKYFSKSCKALHQAQQRAAYRKQYEAEQAQKMEKIRNAFFSE